MARIQARTSESVTAVESWSWLATAPDAHGDPASLPMEAIWQDAAVPGTVGGTLRALGRLTPEAADAIGRQDHWYRTTLTRPLDGGLHFEGLASWTEIWIDGVLRAESRSMFQPLELAVQVRAGAEIALCFRALAPKLAAAPRRSRWRPMMIQPNGLRWFRTTALGSMPGWTSPGLPTGPYRAVSRIDRDSGPVIGRLDVRTRHDGRDGTIEAVVTLAEGTPAPARAVLRCGASRIAMSGEGGRLSATLVVPGAARWFPHTHGEPALHHLSLAVDDDLLDIGTVGFRSLAVERDADGEGFGLVVNGVEVFCRGACWSSPDAVTLSGGRAAYEPWLRLARDAGMNMIRVPGTMAYEDDAFFALCDELGLMVWQDMMLANFDYPQADAGFREALKAEAEALLDRTQTSPCLVVLCGGSEVFQQAAMLGAPPEAWSGPIFDEILPDIVARLRPDVAYVPNSPSGGALPFVADKGVTHYYGVGAYLRGLDDARRARVRFASECLAFAQLPEEVSLAASGLPVATHHPDWKRGVPRDLGASWDFEDVRDHYVGLLYALDPVSLRREDPERYFALSRAATAEVMEATFDEWRRPGSPTRGGLVLMLQDVMPGAGWGVIASDGEPKSAFHGLARAFRPVQLSMTDEGVNGLALHVVNERPFAMRGKLSLRCLKEGRIAVMEGTCDIELPPHASRTLSAFDLLGRFFDISYAYRFGPPGHDVTTAVLTDAATGEVLAEAFQFPLGRGHERQQTGLAASLRQSETGWVLDLTTERFAQSVHIHDEVWRPAQNWFHLAPGATRTVALVARAAGAPAPSGEVRAVNAWDIASYRAR